MSDSPEDRLRLARRAQTQWIAMPFRARRALLKRLRHLLLEHTDEIVSTVQNELGKPGLDTLSGDVMVTLEQMLYYEKRAERWLRPRSVESIWPFLRGTKTREIYEPHGAVLVFAPWNYPVQLALVPAITALYAGNAVLCKCSEYAPGISRLLQRIVNDAGLPNGLFQISWENAGAAALLLDAKPDFVFFTGSSAVGRKIAERAGQLLIPSAMELGGKDAAVVFASCNFERAVNGLVYGAFSNAGQVCVSAKRIYVEAAIFERFFKAFEAKAAKLRMKSDIGPLMVEPMRRRLQAQVADAQAKGAIVSSAGNQDLGPEEAEMPPHIVRHLTGDAALSQEETFGPVTCIAPFQDEAEAIALANSSEFGLSASVWTSDAQQAERFAEAVRSGSCVVNDVIRNVSHPGAAFGGVGASGYGRYHGLEGLRTFSRIKTVMTVSVKSPSQINWFPFSEKTEKQLQALLRFRHGSGGLRERAIKMMRTMRGGAR